MFLSASVTQSRIRREVNKTNISGMLGHKEIFLSVLPVFCLLVRKLKTYLLFYFLFYTCSSTRPVAHLILLEIPNIIQTVKTIFFVLYC